MSIRAFMRRKRGLWLIAGLPLAAVLVSAIFFSRPRALTRAPALAQATAGPAVVEVRRGALRKTLLTDGELRAVRSRTIFTPASDDMETKITYLPPEGSTVKPGDRLVELDTGTITNRIKEVEERIVASENEIIRTQAQHEAALRDMEVELSKLWLALEKAKIKARIPAELLPRRDYQENQLAGEKAKIDYETQWSKMEQKKKEQAAELQVKAIEKDKQTLQIQRLQDRLDSLNIKAPIEGMVLYGDHYDERRKLQVGDLVWGGYPLVSLPDLAEMQVIAPVNEVDGPKLSVGQPATILLDSYPDIRITGSVKEIAQTAVKASGRARAKVFRVAIQLDRTVTAIMKPGMSAQVAVVTDEIDGQLLVPRSAVSFEGDTARVWRLEGEAGRRPVTVTIVSADPVHYAVAGNDALKEGDRILR